MIKIAIYVRVSTTKQEAMNQLTQLREYCSKSNYTIFKEYIDIISGKENSRPNYDLMFQDAHKRLFDLVLFWDLSRFSRGGTLFTLQKLKELENLGINWESYQESYFKSIGDFKDVIISIMATLAKIEREKISERTKAGLVGKKNVGKRGKDKKHRRTRSDRGLKRKPHTDNYIETSGGMEHRAHREIKRDVKINKGEKP
jgi:DNA invertase Pin-like site-specific DNA recombinase